MAINKVKGTLSSKELSATCLIVDVCIVVMVKYPPAIFFGFQIVKLGEGCIATVRVLLAFCSAKYWVSSLRYVVCKTYTFT
tara:strand:+ start:2503 stop:2745 length:243 start_codon:yes stop_codon:yes gene_type:complete